MQGCVESFLHSGALAWLSLGSSGSYSVSILRVPSTLTTPSSIMQSSCDMCLAAQNAFSVSGSASYGSMMATSSSLPKTYRASGATEYPNTTH